MDYTRMIIHNSGWMTGNPFPARLSCLLLQNYRRCELQSKACQKAEMNTSNSCESYKNAVQILYTDNSSKSFTSRCILYIYSYYTITDAKLYRGLVYPTTLLGGYASFSDQAVLQGLQVGSKISNRFGCFRIGWFELRVWQCSITGEIWIEKGAFIRR